MKSSMAKKKLVSACLAVMMVVSIGAIGVSANDYGNTYFPFNFSPENPTQYTGVRVKEDNSYAWMHCDAAEYSYTAHVYAQSDTNSPPIAVNCSPKTGRIYTYTFSDTQGNNEHYMTNWAIEDGYSLAGISAYSNTHYYDSASGVWSPDSI